MKEGRKEGESETQQEINGKKNIITSFGKKSQNH